MYLIIISCIVSGVVIGWILVQIAARIKRNNRLAASRAIPISSLMLPRQAENELIATGISYLGSAEMKTRKELLKIKRVGKIQVDRIDTALQSHGMELRK